MQKLNLPKFTFWNKIAKKISFINMKEVNSLVAKLQLGEMSLLNSMGISDSLEIINRQETMKLLNKYPELRKFIMRHDLSSVFPGNEISFLDQFNVNSEHSLFVKKLKHLLAVLRKIKQKEGRFVGSVKTFFDFLQDNLEAINVNENEFALVAGKEISKGSFMQGSVDYDLTLQANGYDVINDASSRCFGHKRYSYNERLITIPYDWSEFKWWAYRYLLPWNGVRIYLHNSRAMKVNNTTSIIEKTPPVVIETIRDFLEYRVVSPIWQELAKTSKDFPDSVRFRIRCLFTYNHTGLKVKLGSIQPLGTSIASKEDFAKVYPFLNNDLIGYSKDKLESFKEFSMSTYSNLEIKNGTLQVLMAFWKALEVQKEYRKLIYDGMIIESRNVDIEFKLFSMKQVCELEDISPYHQNIMTVRDFIGHHFETLQSMAKMMDTFADRAQSWNLPFSFPDILGEEHHLIEFSKLLPVHLINRTKVIGGDEVKIKPDDLVPITMPSLNGRMVALTGQNAGGKTVALVSLMDNIYLAQSGLPVFAESFALNPKETVATVFIEKGEGSLLELVLGKIKNVIEVSKVSNPNKTIVVMDELLSGTQEMAGRDLGEEVLKKLNTIGCSVIFNTQITALAEFAETDLNALTFKFDLDHLIKPGIGSGGSKRLADQIGLTAVLES